VVALRSALTDKDAEVRKSAEMELETINIRSNFAFIVGGTLGAGSAPYGTGGLSGAISLGGSLIANSHEKRCALAAFIATRISAKLTMRPRYEWARRHTQFM
jgi:hypothetical protein